jgi:hypothetical protein
LGPAVETGPLAASTVSETLSVLGHLFVVDDLHISPSRILSWVSREM